MPFYIATIWTLSVNGEAVFGDKAIERRVVRQWAADEQVFENAHRDLYTQQVDDMVWFGPIGLSTDQRTQA